MFAFSCNQNLLLQENDDFVPEGYVKISFNEGTFGRSAVYTAGAVTKDDVDKVILTGTFMATAENMVNIPSEKLVLSENFTSYADFSAYTAVIPEGPWEFTLNITSSHTGELAWTGTKAATISKTNKTVKIDLEHKTSEKGLLDAKITFPHNVSDSVKYKIVPVDSSSSADLSTAIAEKSAGTITLDVSGDFVSISEKLKHGHYIVVLSFYKETTLLNHYNLVVEIKAGAVTTVNHNITDLNQQFSIYFDKNNSDANFVSGFTQTRTYNKYENITLPKASCFSTIPSGKVFAGWAASQTAETGITGWSAGDKSENLTLYAVWKTVGGTPSKKLSSIELFEYGQVTSVDPGAPTGDARKKIGTYEYIQSFDSSITSYITDVYTTNPYVLQLKEYEQNQEIKIKQGDNELTAFKDDGAELRTLSYEIDPKKDVVILINGENAYSLTLKASGIYYVRGSTQAVLDPAPDYFNLSGSKEYPFNDVQTAVNIIQNTSHTGTIYIDGCVEVEVPGKENVVDFNDASGDIKIEGYSLNTLGGTIKAKANSGQRVLGVWKGKVTLGSKLTISGGNFTGDCGGAIFNDAELTLDGCIITGNSVTGTYSMGGALYCNKGSKTFINAGTKITSNTAKHGGAVTVAGGTLIVEGGEITSNTVFSGGSGTGIFVKTYVEYNSGNRVTGSEKNSIFQVSGSPVISDFIYLDDDQTDTLASTLEKITIAGNLSEILKVQLHDSSAGNLVAQLNSGVDLSNYEKLEIYNADGTKSTDVKVGANGKLEDLNAQTGNISIDGFNKTTVSPGNFTRTYISKSDNVNNYLEFNVTDAAYAAISKGNVSSVFCSLYDYKGEPVLNMLGMSCQITGSAGSYKALYYPDVSNREIGEYTVVVTAVSGDASVEIESVSIKIWVVY